MDAKEVLEIRAKDPQKAFRSEIDWDEVQNIITGALHKQVPIKPDGDGYNEPWLCPTCDYNLSMHVVNTDSRPKYCCECGQALDWQVMT